MYFTSQDSAIKTHLTNPNVSEAHNHLLLRKTNHLLADLVDALNDDGVLVPLRTHMELAERHESVDVFITRVPTRCASAALSMISSLLPSECGDHLVHLRRCAKPADLASHLKATFMNDVSGGRQMHAGKSTWIYVLVGIASHLDHEELITNLASLEGIGDHIFLARIPVPSVPPSSQMQAAMWSQSFWPTIYRKNNPLGPHPSMVSRATDEIASDTTQWMRLAFQLAASGRSAGIGEPVGAVVVKREGQNGIVVAAAADARWHSTHGLGSSGNCLSHCSLRCISMVAQKLVRVEDDKTWKAPDSRGLAFDALQDLPLLEEERAVFELEHPNPDGYLCHGLELYLTHEPCVMCSMAILHSRMGKVIFAQRMPLTGGLSAERRQHSDPAYEGATGSQGLGLFWRRELNWSLLAWEWEPCPLLPVLPSVSPNTHT